MQVWRHKKTEGIYYELGRSMWNGILHVIYFAQSDHKVWVRNAPEFDDGRFESLGLSESTFVFTTYPIQAVHEADLRPLLINKIFEISEVI